MANIIGDIVRIVDNNGKAQWQETHERAVRDSAGVTLETKLTNINNNISQLDQKEKEDTTVSHDVSSSIGGWTNGNNTSYAEFSLDAAGHNGTWTLKKASATSSRIGIDCRALENGRRYRIRMTIAISDNKALSNLAAGTSRTGTVSAISDVNGNDIPFNAPGIDAVVEKTASWSVLVVTHSSGQGHTYPVTVTISNFSVEDVEAVTSAVKVLQSRTSDLEYKQPPFADGNNLFDWRGAYKSSLETDGAISGSNSYWVTGFIPVDPTVGTSVMVNYVPYRVALYNGSKTFQSLLSGQALRTALPITGAAYAVFCFANNTVALADANKVFINYANASDVASSKVSIDGGKMSLKDSQYFTIADILPLALDAKDNKFTQSFTFVLEKGDQGNKNMVVSMNAMFTNDEDTAVPTVKFELFYRASYSMVYESMEYTSGSKDIFEEKQWRIPPFRNYCRMIVTVTIPANVTLYIKSFDNAYDNAINRNCPAYIFDGFGSGNVLRGFVRNAKLGFPSCITVPKRTSDGVWVCFHDEVIGSQLKDADGHTPADNHPEITGDVGIWDLTFEELQTYSYDAEYDGNQEKVPTLEAYFLICAKTGMRPMLSMHPTPSAEEYAELKALAVKCGVLSQLELKPLVAGIGAAVTAFGDDISAYILQATTISAASAISTLNAAGIDNTKVRVGAEYFGDSANLTVQGVADLVAAGYVVSLYASDFTAEQYRYWMSKGVTEFTEGHNTSYGLNW